MGLTRLVICAAWLFAHNIRGVGHIMAAKWELMLAILTMNHLTWNKIQIYNLQFFLDQPPCFQGHMNLVDETGSSSYLHP